MNVWESMWVYAKRYKWIKCMPNKNNRSRMPEKNARSHFIASYDSLPAPIPITHRLAWPIQNLFQGSCPLNFVSFTVRPLHLFSSSLLRGFLIFFFRQKSLLKIGSMSRLVIVKNWLKIVCWRLFSYRLIENISYE